MKDSKQWLLRNLEAHNVSLPEVSGAKHVCSACSDRLKRAFCSRCSKPFPIRENQASAYQAHPEIAELLAPYSPDYSSAWHRLCPGCYQTCLSSCTEVQDRLEAWVGETKAEFIRGYRTLKALGRVEYTGRSCSLPAEVEEYLKLYSTQLGGNGFVKYYWEKHEERHAERVLVGYSKNNNPYYRTEYRTERWFTGYATAVLVAPFKKRAEPAARADRVQAPPPAVQPGEVKLAILDGLNICCWANPDQRSPDIDILLTLCVALSRKGIPFFCFFDANTPHVLREQGSVQAAHVYSNLLAKLSSRFSEVPGGMRADEFILQKADTDNAHIISNDQYRDYENHYRWLITGKRLVKGLVADKRLQVPVLRLDLTIEADTEQALEYLKKTARA